MDPFLFMVFWPAAILSILVIAIWEWLLRQRLEFVGWRRRASLAALVCPTLAFAICLLMAGMVYLYGSLGALDNANGLASRALAGLQILHGVLSASGIVLSAIGTGRPRFAAATLSLASLALFLVSSFVAVNSFH